MYVDAETEGTEHEQRQCTSDINVRRRKQFTCRELTVLRFLRILPKRFFFWERARNLEIVRLLCATVRETRM